MKIDWPFTKWPAIYIPAEAGKDPEEPNKDPAEAHKDMCAQALIMRCGSYEAAREALDRNKDWLKPLDRNVDDRVLLDIAHSLPLSDNAALTKVANMAYSGKAAAAALRRLRSKLPRVDKNSEFGPLHLWWRKRWGKFLEPGGRIIGVLSERFRRRRPEK